MSDYQKVLEGIEDALIGVAVCLCAIAVMLTIITIKVVSL